MSFPGGLFYDEANQDRYIVNSGSAATVKRWKVGEANGTVVAGTVGSAGSSPTQLSSPMGITLDQWKNLYVADRTNNRVQLFCNGSLTGVTIAGASTGGSSLSTPFDVRLDSQLNLYVTENTGGNMVKRFDKL